jgi:hypothetical protein
MVMITVEQLILRLQGFPPEAVVEVLAINYSPDDEPMEIFGSWDELDMSKHIRFETEGGILRIGDY